MTKRPTRNEAWVILKTLPDEKWHELRRAAVDRIIGMRGRDSGHGISSSDVNHTAVDLLVSGEFEA